MADMYTFYQASERVTPDILIKGVPYRIMFAQKCLTPIGVRLILKLRAHPQNIYVMPPNYCAGPLEMSQIDRIDKEKLFINIYWGRQPSGDHIIVVRNADAPTPTYSEMQAAAAIGN
jgi:hypothetical protein